MKKVISILFLICLLGKSAYAKDTINKGFTDWWSLDVFASAFQAAGQIASFQDQDKKKEKVFKLLENIFFLSHKLSKNNIKDSESLIPEVESLVTDLFDLLKLEGLSSNSFCQNLTYFSQLEKTEDQLARGELIEYFLKTQDRKIVSDFLREVFDILSGYLKTKVRTIFVDFKKSFKDYFKAERSALLRLGKKESQFISAISGTIANIFSQATQNSAENNPNQEPDPALVAVSTICGLVSSLASINAENKKNISSELRELYNITDPVAKRAWIYEKLLTSPFFKKMVKELFEVLKSYLRDQMADLLTYLCDKLINTLSKPNIVEVDIDNNETESCAISSIVQPYDWKTFWNDPSLGYKMASNNETS